MRAEPKLKSRARQLRHEATEPERWLWRRLSNSQLGGFKFRRQAAIPPFIADFFCPAKALIVEVDGATHIARKDAFRDAFLADRGFTTIRFTNDEVRDNMDGVLNSIFERLCELPDRWPSSSVDPTPTPPLKGRVE